MLAQPNDFDVLTWLDKDGNIISQKPTAPYFRLSACHPETQAQQPLDNHHELVGKAVGIIREQAVSNIGGMLGNRFSTRYRIVQLLEQYYDQGENLFFNADRREELKYAIDDIYNYPLQETSKFHLWSYAQTNRKASR